MDRQHRQARAAAIGWGILLLIGALPTWGHSRGWGYGPSGILGLVVVVLIILLLMGRI
jgi:hypothetical protein